MADRTARIVIELDADVERFRAKVREVVEQASREVVKVGIDVDPDPQRTGVRRVAGTFAGTGPDLPEGRPLAAAQPIAAAGQQRPPTPQDQLATAYYLRGGAVGGSPGFGPGGGGIVPTSYLNSVYGRLDERLLGGGTSMGYPRPVAGPDAAGRPGILPEAPEARSGPRAAVGVDVAEAERDVDRLKAKLDAIDGRVARARVEVDGGGAVTTGPATQRGRTPLLASAGYAGFGGAVPPGGFAAAGGYDDGPPLLGRPAFIPNDVGPDGRQRVRARRVARPGEGGDPGNLSTASRLEPREPRRRGFLSDSEAASRVGTTIAFAVGFAGNLAQAGADYDLARLRTAGDEAAGLNATLDYRRDLLSSFPVLGGPGYAIGEAIAGEEAYGRRIALGIQDRRAGDLALRGSRLDVLRSGQELQAARQGVLPQPLQQLTAAEQVGQRLPFEVAARFDPEIREQQERTERARAAVDQALPRQTTDLYTVERDARGRIALQSTDYARRVGINPAEPAEVRAYNQALDDSDRLTARRNTTLANLRASNDEQQYQARVAVDLYGRAQNYGPANARLAAEGRDADLIRQQGRQQAFQQSAPIYAAGLNALTGGRPGEAATFFATAGSTAAGIVGTANIQADDAEYRRTVGSFDARLGIGSSQLARRGRPLDAELAEVERDRRRALAGRFGNRFDPATGRVRGVDTFGEAERRDFADINDTFAERGTAARQNFGFDTAQIILGLVTQRQAIEARRSGDLYGASLIEQTGGALGQAADLARQQRGPQALGLLANTRAGLDAQREVFGRSFEGFQVSYGFVPQNPPGVTGTIADTFASFDEQRAKLEQAEAGLRNSGSLAVPGDGQNEIIRVLTEGFAKMGGGADLKAALTDAFTAALERTFPESQ